MNRQLSCKEFSHSENITDEHDWKSISDEFTSSVDDGKAPPKKKKGKVIPSRYKQNSFKSSKSTSKLEESQPYDKSKSSYFCSEKSFLVPVKFCRDSKISKTASDAGENSSSRKLNITQLSTTPEARGKGKQSSTPTSDKSSDGLDIVDLSAIGSVASQSLRHFPVHKTLFKDNKHTKLDCTNSTQKSEAGKMTTADKQQHLDILYSQYLQWVFMDSKLNKVFYDQENKALSQIYNLQNECCNLEDEKQSLTLENMDLHYSLESCEILSKREEVLKPLLKNLPTFSEQYSKLANGLDTTCHRIPTSNIYFPDDKDIYHKRLEENMKESEKLMSEINTMVFDNSSNISELSQSFVTMANTIEADMESLKKCNEISSAIEVMTLNESSLKIGELHNSM